MTPVTRLDWLESSRKYENSIFCICRFSTDSAQKEVKKPDFEESFLEVVSAFGGAKVSKILKIDENMFKQCFLTMWTSIKSIRVELEVYEQKQKKNMAKNCWFAPILH